VPLHRHWYDTRETKPIRDFEIVRARVSRFCNFIYSNPRAVERIAFLDSLSSYKRVDSGGKIRNNIGGPVLDKMKFIAASKFTIAFENESVSGYATEKIIQPLLVGSIPIYWGDPSIELDFNPEAFVNVHRYSSFDEVVAEIERIDQNEDLWRRYVTAPIFPDGRMPDELTDEALIGFFDSIFRYRRRYVSRSRKFGQRWMHSVKRLQVGIESTRLSRGITRLFRR
jgi:hypothetical protein